MRMSFCRALMVVCCAFLTAACAVRTQNKELTGKHVPWTRFTMLDGEYRAMQEFQGRQTVVVFWASWCHKSYRMLRKLNAFAGRAASRDAVFLAVNLDKAEKIEDVKERIAANHLDTLSHAFSGNDVADEAFIALQGDNLPYVVVIDKKGFILAAGNSDEPVYQSFNVDPESVPEVSGP